MAMKSNQMKATIVQWLIPTLVLVVIVVVMLFNFSVKTSQSVSEEVDENFISVAERYAAEINHELGRMSDAGKPIGYLMKGYISSNKQFMVEMAESLCHNTDAYAVVYYAKGEDALLHDGTKVNIVDTAYFPKIEAAFQDVESKTSDSDDVAVRYIYITDDELGFGKEAIVAIVSVDNMKQGDKLFLYYEIEKLQKLFNTEECDANNFYALINSDGLVMEQAGKDSLFLQSGNVLEAIKRDPTYNERVVKATIRIKNQTSGSLEAEIDDEERTIVYAPTGINDWAVVIGINEDYIDDLESSEWKNTKAMVYQLVAAIFIFLGLVAGINVLNRIRSSQENKELEMKADTDLLTSLNNKLATERKIKEYMANYPNEQGLLFVLDIDNFKKINDTLGHAFGDEVLRTLGHQIGSVFRATDVIGRTGGDEFTIFLKHLNSDEVLEREAKKLADFFKSFQAGEYVRYAATASIGVAVFPKDGKDFESLYKAADSALYTAKKRGKSQLAFYGEESQKSEGIKRVEAESRSRG